ncbi:MAG: cysteine desulfurase [Alphaproteobacteria bacterium]|nr:cysteine desulfurase [Alphaproteobacteria bacterium]MCS5597724.1 cysteine desulfurase [Alphaproteobacteria bacterium]|tara:strand:- start:398356 stop:399471 length:1116 start_codon:yes stop_codon:yes gene_type:complete
MAIHYFDYNATAPIRDEVVELMAAEMRIVGNASAVHKSGQRARGIVEKAREQMGAFVNVEPNQIIFNSGASEGNNTLIHGFVAQGYNVIVSDVEHPAVIKPSGERVHFIPVDENGVIQLEALEALLAATPRPVLVSVMYVNNEAGIIQPVAEVGALCKKYEALFHTDAVQAAGKISLDMDAIGADYITLSAHKYGGPQGIGVLAFAKGKPPPKLILGGSQEGHQRAGTMNVAGIAGMGLASEMAAKDIAHYESHIRPWRDDIERMFMDAKRQDGTPRVDILAKDAPRVPNTSLFMIHDLKADTLMMKADMAGICASSGAACSSGTVKTSRTVAALRPNLSEPMPVMRLSMGWKTSQADVDAFIKFWQKLTS